VIFLLLYLVFKSATEAAVLIFPTFYAMSGGLLLQWLLGFNSGSTRSHSSESPWRRAMVVYLREALERRIASGKLGMNPISNRPRSTVPFNACGPSS
jgi:copper/silver efflux system protein